MKKLFAFALLVSSAALVAVIAQEPDLSPQDTITSSSSVTDGAITLPESRRAGALPPASASSPKADRAQRPRNQIVTENFYGPATAPWMDQPNSVTRVYRYADGRTVTVPNSSAYPMATEDFELAQEAAEQQAILANEKTKESEKEAAKEKLKEIFSKQFDRDLEKRRKDLEQLEEKLAKLKEIIAKREKAREELVDLRIKLIENDAEGLGFPGQWSGSALLPTLQNPAPGSWTGQYLLPQLPGAVNGYPGYADPNYPTGPGLPSPAAPPAPNPPVSTINPNSGR